MDKMFSAFLKTYGDGGSGSPSYFGSILEMKPVAHEIGMQSAAMSSKSVGSMQTDSYWKNVSGFVDDLKSNFGRMFSALPNGSMVGDMFEKFVDAMKSLNGNLKDVGAATPPQSGRQVSGKYDSADFAFLAGVSASQERQMG